jgi:acetate kinase
VLILVLNCGSSSIKADLVDHHTAQVHTKLRVQRVGDVERCSLTRGEETRTLGQAGENHAKALEAVLPELLESLGENEAVAGVGHRVVHGGDVFTESVRIDDDVEETLTSLIPLAPLHNPANLAGIRTARSLLPDVPHVAVFDTAFHSTMPRRARSYALPKELAEKHGLRRYGFHGTSHHYVAARAARHLEADLRELRLITCHLGNGASMAAVEYGRSIDTTMGMTPLEGLVMGTRSGDVDPGLLAHLQRVEGLDADALDHLLNKESGLKGLSGLGNDLRDIEAAASEGNEAAQLAIHVYTHRIRKYVGAFAALMGGVDAIVFTAGVGENSALIRRRVCQNLSFLGARLDEEANRTVALESLDDVAQISTGTSRCHLLAIKTNEEFAIAQDTAALVSEADRVNEPTTIPVAVSARHAHFDRATLDALFGEGYELAERAPLSQPGQYASEETVTLIGPKRSLEGVRILGPLRGKNQIEISRTDEFFLGLDAPVRGSGDVKNSPGVTVVGPKGRVELDEGLICAWRHIHMTPDDAEHFGVKNRDVVEVAIDSDGRDLIFGDVLVRVSAKYALEMHIDTDEANAAEISRGVDGILVDTTSCARVLKRSTKYDATTG